MSAPILSAYDYEMSIGQIRHLRAGFLDNVNNGMLQFRYVYPDGTVEWRNLITGLTSVNFNFTAWWDNVNSQGRLLFVNGLPVIYEWSGGITTLASASSTSNAVSSITTGLFPDTFMPPDSFGGKNYIAGDTLTLTGGDANATVRVNNVVDGGIWAINSTPTTAGTGYTAGDVLAIDNGSISTINPTPTNGGAGYTVGDILNVDTGVGGTVKVVAISGSGSTGPATTIALQNGGAGYVTGTGQPTSGGTGIGCSVDITAINAGGGSSGLVNVLTVDGSGHILTVSLRSSGAGYTTGVGQTTVGGSGTGATIDVTEVEDGVIGDVTLINGGTGYSVASGVAVTGGSGTDALMNILAITPNGITKQGTTTWAQEGFYNTGTHQVVINGVNYTATGGWNSLTLTGVTPDPTGAGVPGDVIVQAVEEIDNSELGGGIVPIDFENDLILTFDQQLYLGSLIANTIFVSMINNYRDFNDNTSAGVRVTGDGITLIANAPPRAFLIQQDEMYVSAGISQWYTVSQNTIDTTLVDPVTDQTVTLAVVTPTLNRLKTTGLQGAISQAFVSNDKNDLIFVSNEPIVNSLGPVTNILTTPQISDLSFPIVNDMNGYDFTDGCIFFWQNFIIVAVPKENLIRLYNMTKDTTTQNPTNSPLHYWEAPLTMPFSRFSIIDGELYGHSYLVSETYKMFEGYNFNGHPIPAAAVFAYQQFGVRTTNKSENEFFVEGYISPNATLDMTVNFELNGYGGQYNGSIVGTDTSIVQVSSGLNSLGKESLGKNPLGGDLVVSNNLANKFRVIKTYPRTPYYEASPSFYSSGIDYVWSLIGFGPASAPTSEGNNPITQ